MMKNFIVLISLLLAVLSRVFAQDCSQIYHFNINDKSSYSTSCGYVDGSDWKVVKNSCNFYTPLANMSGKTGEAKRWVDIRIRLGNSGNLDDKDFAWIFYYVNGKAQTTKTIKGNEVDEVVDFRDSLLVPAGGTFKLRIAFVCDEQDEFWKLTNGDLTTCVRAVAGETPVESPNSSGKITFIKEREIVKLVWQAPSTPTGNYFQIERSKDGSDYEFAGYVKDNRAGNSISQYSFIDAGCFKPQTWYRITQIDLQGTTKPFGKPALVTF